MTTTEIGGKNPDESLAKSFWNQRNISTKCYQQKRWLNFRTIKHCFIVSSANGILLAFLRQLTMYLKVCHNNFLINFSRKKGFLLSGIALVIFLASFLILPFSFCTPIYWQATPFRACFPTKKEKTWQMNRNNDQHIPNIDQKKVSKSRPNH